MTHPIHIAAFVVLLICAAPFIVAAVPSRVDRWARLKHDAERARASHPERIARVFSRDPTR